MSIPLKLYIIDAPSSRVFECPFLLDKSLMSNLATVLRHFDLPYDALHPTDWNSAWTPRMLQLGPHDLITVVPVRITKEETLRMQSDDFSLMSLYQKAALSGQLSYFPPSPVPHLRHDSLVTTANQISLLDIAYDETMQRRAMERAAKRGLRMLAEANRVLRRQHDSTMRALSRPGTGL